VAMAEARLDEIRIVGYRCFGDFRARPGPFEVIVGANGSGKTSLFEFLRFLRDSLEGPIPAEIVPGSVGRDIFHRPGPDQLVWDLTLSSRESDRVQYRGGVDGPLGRVVISQELLLAGPDRRVVFSRSADSPHTQRVAGNYPNRLLLQWYGDEPAARSVSDFLGGMQFYGSYAFSAQVRRPAVIEQSPKLKEDCSNLSAVLFYLQSERREAFNAIQQLLGLMIPGFRRLNVLARGGPGEVLAFIDVAGIALTLADISDGQLRLLFWATMCHLPEPGTLICIDEPDQGLHPRVLPVVAEMFKAASEHAQIFLATHNSFFLRQFEVADIAVMRLEKGEPAFIKPSDSAVLKANLEDFGTDEIERMHQTEELEKLA